MAEAQQADPIAQQAVERADATPRALLRVPESVQESINAIIESIDTLPTSPNPRRVNENSSRLNATFLSMAQRPGRFPRGGNGNDASRDAPAQNDTGDPDSKFNPFFTNVGAVATLGASITFALIVSQLQDPLEGVAAKKRFDLSTVRIFIATSWLLFTIALVSSFYLAVVVKNRRAKNGDDRIDISFGIAGLLYVPMAGAFLYLSLAVMAYLAVVGIVAVALIGTFSMVLIFVALSPWCGLQMDLLRDMFAILFTI